jgi:hypothetical protein
VRVRAVTTVWGSWHVEQLLSVALPSLVSEGNLPEFCKTHELIYEFRTTRRDANRIVASPAFSVLDGVVPVEIHLIDEDSTEAPIAAHHRMWLEAVQRAAENREMILFIPPDTVWADGSLRSLAHRLSEGKVALFNAYLRTESDSFVPALLERFPTSPGRLRVQPRDLVDLCLQHLHPLMTCYFQESGHLPEHAEYLLWPVLGEGVLLRLLARELLCFDPARIRLNEQALIAELPDPGSLHLFTDSDEFCAVSLTPPWKDTDWYQQPRMLDAVRIATWWLAYDSPVNDFLCRQTVRFHRGTTDSTLWKDVEEASRAVIERIVASRNILRLCRVLRVAGMNRSAVALAAALLDLDLSQTWKTPATLFLPTNSGLPDDPGWQFSHVLMDWEGLKLSRFIAAHTVPGLVEIGGAWSSGRAPSARQSLRSELGATLELDASSDPPRIGSATVVGHAFDLDSVRIYPIDAPLPFKAQVPPSRLVR